MMASAAAAAAATPPVVASSASHPQPHPMPFPSCTVLWSTQSGRAKACARRTARLLRSQGVAIRGGGGDGGGAASAVVGHGCAFDAYGAANFLEIGGRDPVEATGSPPSSSSSSSTTETSTPRQQLVVLFVSTTGDAEQCDSIRETWAALLRKSLPTDLLVNVRFALFALGDRAYGPTAFCASGRKLAARLVQLGARPFCAVGYGDDGTPNGGVFADLDVWLEAELLPKISPGGVVVDDAVRLLADVPYRVERMQEVGADGDADAVVSGRSAESTEEWQQDRYRPSYDEFFATQCPATAYRYDEQSGKRRRRSANDSDDFAGPTADPPLVGRVVSNDRITSDDWMQDTRHIRIHVDLDGRHSPQQTDSSTRSAVLRPDRDHLPYVAGDVATILPSNSAESVDRFLSVLPRAVQSTADIPIHITSQPGRPTAWPERCTLRGLLTHCADINSLPEREDLRSLAPYCNLDHPAGPDHRDKLVSLSETTDAALYGDYVLREKRCWTDVLYDFDSIQSEAATEGEGEMMLRKDPALTVEHLLTILPPIMPRHFSIASSPSRGLLLSAGGDATDAEHERRGGGFDVELCVAVVRGITPHGRSYTGLCSGYLSRLVPKSESGHLPVKIWIKPGSFDGLPLRPDSRAAGVNERYFETPLLCIGAGTGIAPLRALILEREAVRSLNTKRDAIATVSNGSGEGAESDNDPKNSKADSDNTLVFGCRTLFADFYYNQEWKDLVSARRLRLLTAFSRDQYHKIYVQRVVREADDGTLISRHILEDGGAVYIAGGAKMAHAVKDELVECIGKALPGGERDAKALLRKMAKVGRFSIEAWS